MWTLFTILVIAAAYFGVVSRGRAAVPEAIDAETAGQLFLEIETEDDGAFHAVVIDVSDDNVLHVTNGYPTAEEAENAGRLWIKANE
jgi:hypothetical protein